VQINDPENLAVPSTMGINDPLLNQLARDLVTLSQTKATKLLTQTEQHPQIVKLNEQIVTTKKALLENVNNLVNNAQMLNFTGWKSFDNNRNRFAIINDYLEESLKPMRQLQYDYYRTGLDEMATNVERGRTNITSAIENNLKIAHENRPMSLLPQIWTDYKKDELGNIYNGHGNQKEKQSVYDILMSINASQNNTWDKILK